MSGKLIISFDFELGWGGIENGLWSSREKMGVYKQMPETIASLVNLFDKHEFPVTWAVVGAMMQDSSTLDVEHIPDHYRKLIKETVTAARADTFFAPDLVSLISETNVNHEICSHSYSHVRFDLQGVTEKVIQRELCLFEQALKPVLSRAASFIYPYNIEKYEIALSKYGYLAIRGGALQDYNSRLGAAYNYFFNPPPMSYCTSINDNTFRYSGSMLFNPGYKHMYRLPFVERRARRGIQMAASSGDALHIWCHPFNFSEKPELLKAFTRFVEYVLPYRERGELDVVTMINHHRSAYD